MYNRSVRIFISIIVLLVAGATIFQLRGLAVKRNELQDRFQDVSEKVSVLNRENAALKNELEILSRPESLVREAKAQFNYAAPGEKLIILVPGQ